MKFRMKTIAELYLRLLYQSCNSRGDFRTGHISMPIIIVFAKFKDSFPKLLNSMRDIRTFQLNISFLAFIRRTKHIITLRPILQSTAIYLHSFIRQTVRIMKSDNTSLFLKLYDRIRCFLHAFIRHIPHRFNKLSKSLPISCEAESIASAEIKRNSSSIIE